MFNKIVKPKLVNTEVPGTLQELVLRAYEAHRNQENRDKRKTAIFR